MKSDRILAEEIKREDAATREFALGSIRSAVLRIDEIRQEMINAGLALKGGYITPQAALEWCDEFAPGCLGYIPHGSGLALPPKSREVRLHEPT